MSEPLEVKEDMTGRIESGWARSGVRALPLYELEPSNADLMHELIGSDEEEDEMPDVLDFIKRGHGW